MADLTRRHKAFRKILQRISRNLTDENLQEMMALVVGIEGFPGRKDVQNVTSGLQFFLILENHDKLSPDNVEELVELLDDVNRRDLVKILQEAIKETAGRSSTIDDSDVPATHRYHPHFPTPDSSEYHPHVPKAESAEGSPSLDSYETMAHNETRAFQSLSSHPEQFDRHPLQGIMNQMESIVEKSDPDTSDYGGEILPPSRASTASVESGGHKLQYLSLDAEKGDGSISYDLETDAPQENVDESALNISHGYSKSILPPDEHTTSGISSAHSLSEDSSPLHYGSRVESRTSEMQEDKMERLKAKDKCSLAEQRAGKSQGLVQPSFESVTDKSTKKIELRSYQEELAAPAMNGGNYIICAPTGCGKTLTAAAICRKRYDAAKSRGNDFKALFIVNMSHLTRQQTTIFQDTFPDGTIGTVGETDTLSKVFYDATHAVVMITAQILLNALRGKEPDIHLGDISMIIFDECHLTTQEHVYNEIMKLYLKTKKTGLGSHVVAGKPGRNLPQILGLSASLGVGHGNDAYKHVLTLCGNLDAANVIQIVHNKDELEEFVNSPELDKIRYVPPRQTKGGEFFKIIDKIMSDVEREMWPNGVPENHGTSSYEQWAVKRRKEAEKSQERVQLVACLYLFEFNRSLMLYDEVRAKDALRHLEAFMEKRDIKQNPAAIEDICRAYFHSNLERLRRLAAAEEDADNPKLDALGKLLKKTFMENPKSKGIILTCTRLNTEALTDFIEGTAHLRHLQQPVKPTRLVGHGQNHEREGYMTRHEQKVSLQRFREDDSCNLLVATDIAQEELDMPACNFVIRYNFVNSKIGKVQSEGRARAKQSECFLIVEKNSKTAEKELQKRQNIKNMEEAMNRLNALAEKERITEITKRQDEAYRELVRKEEAIARREMYKPEYVGLFCKECNNYITQASYIKRMECHYTCIDPNLRNTIRVVEKPGRKFRTTVNTGVFKCAKEDCGQQLGAAIDFLDIDGETVLLHGFGFRVESFLFKLPDGTPKTYKKWKLVPVDLPEHELEEQLDHAGLGESEKVQPMGIRNIQSGSVWKFDVDPEVEQEPPDTPHEILARGPEAREAYQKAIEEGFKQVYRTRLMFVGQERVGKTSLMKSLTGQSFDASEEITDGVDASTFVEVNEKSWRVNVIASTDFVKHVGSQHDDAVSTIMAYELTKEDQHGNNELNKDENERELASDNDGKGGTYSKEDADDGKEKTLAPVGDIEADKPENGPENEDAEDQNMSQRTASQLSNDVAAANDGKEEMPTPPIASIHIPENIQKKVILKLASRQDGPTEQDEESQEPDFHIWDFAGQDIYYTTHQVFLSHRAIYALVFDLRQDLSQQVKVQVPNTDKDSRLHELTGLEFMDFWMQSIYAYTTTDDMALHEGKDWLSPVIFIVGTHRESEQISTDPDERGALISEKFDSIYNLISGKPYEKHVWSEFFSVENSTNDFLDSELSELRKKILSIKRHEAYMGEKIPLKWLEFERHIADVRKEKHFMNLSQVQEMCATLGIKEDTLFEMLQFYHDLGTIIYFGGRNNTDEKLQDMVILDPQWLIDIFKKIITVKPRREQLPMRAQKWHKLKKEGILEDCIIDYMWKDLLPQKCALLELMKMFDLLCPQVSVEGDETRVDAYYVPACLQPCTEKNVNKELESCEQDICTFYVDFKGFLPDGLFNRLLVRAACWSQSRSRRKPKLYYRYGKFSLDDDHNFQLQMQTSTPVCVKVTVAKIPVSSVCVRGRETTCGIEDRSGTRQPDPTACLSVKEFLDEVITMLTNTWVHGIKYEFCTACLCNELPTAPDCCHLLPLKECLAKPKLYCDVTEQQFNTETYRMWFVGESRCLTNATEEEDLPNVGNYAKVCEAIHILCSMSLPTLKACVQQWHWSQKQVLQLCSGSPTCQCVPHKKPTNIPGACQSCIDWTTSLGSVMHPPAKQLQWNNVDASKFHKDPVEVAKAFMFIIPSGKQVTQFGDFDVGGILKLMMGFGIYHQKNDTCYKKMEKVLNIRNSLSHMKVVDHMAIPEAQLSQWFDVMEGLVNSLKPHQPALEADKIKGCLTQVRKSDATEGMISRAQADLPDSLKQLYDEWKKGMVEMRLQLNEVRCSQQRQEQQLADIKGILLGSTQQQ